jgi:hypothetical protein
MTAAKFSEILDAYEICAYDGPIDVEAFVNLERGTVHIVSDDMELDEPPADLESGPYVRLPDKADLDLGSQLAIDFATERMPDELEAVLGFFRKRGAYGRFKSLLERKGQLQAWYDYEEAATESRLRQWCVDQGIELE